MFRRRHKTAEKTSDQIDEIVRELHGFMISESINGWCGRDEAGSAAKCRRSITVSAYGPLAGGELFLWLTPYSRVMEKHYSFRMQRLQIPYKVFDLIFYELFVVHWRRPMLYIGDVRRLHLSETNLPSLAL